MRELSEGKIGDSHGATEPRSYAENCRLTPSTQKKTQCPSASPRLRANPRSSQFNGCGELLLWAIVRELSGKKTGTRTEPQSHGVTRRTAGSHGAHIKKTQCPSASPRLRANPRCSNTHEQLHHAQPRRRRGLRRVTRSAPRSSKGQYLPRAAGVEHVDRAQPPLACNGHAQREIFEALRRVRVRADAHHRALLARNAARAPVDI